MVPMAMEITPLEPAASIIARFGGAARVQEITGADRTRVYRWARPRAQGGSDGLIPRGPMLKLLAHAREHQIAVTAEDFMPFAASKPERAA